MSDFAHSAPLTGPPPRGKARAHSRLVRVLRIVLPMTMIAVAGMLAGFVAAHAIRQHQAAHGVVSAPIRMLNPHFYGRDAQGRPYILTAREAARDTRSFQTVLLSGPSVTLDNPQGRPSTLVADTGVYHEDTRILLLRGHVRATDAQSGKFASDEAVVNTRTGSVVGPQALQSSSNTGALQSRSFDVYDKGDRMVFKGGVHARLNAH
ncbi:MAG: LPS export ABC transporter periplasmic protein LptC [Caulobacteraceae bacterium]|nr:LPS export ABC transporter periplasmic protein LptC [Caulobacteraceae bacterium]